MTKKQMTIEDLAKIMKKGFDGVDEKFDGVDEKFDGVDEKFDGNTALHQLTRSEMAKDEDLQEIKSTINYLYEILDNEATFIRQMRTEYPLFIKRLKRLEKKLGLPHRITE